MRVGHGLGCLTGCLTRLVLGLVVGTILLAAIAAVLAPWSFSLAAGFIPCRCGRASERCTRSQAITSCMSGWRPRRADARSTSRTSEAGAISARRVANGTRSACRQTWTRTPESIRTDMRWTSAWRGARGTTSGRSRAGRAWAFVGGGRTPISWWTTEAACRAFRPDGTVYLGPARDQPAPRETLPIVLHEAAWSGWFSDCRGAK